MTTEQAMEFVDELSVLKFFPAQPKARGALAAKLLEWCKGSPGIFPSEQARWLVKMTLELDEYPGPVALRKMLDDRFFPAGAAAVYKSQNYGPLRIGCAACEDWWTVVDLATGKRAWCNCRNAREMQAENPTWVDFVNRFPGAARIEPKKMLSHKEFYKRIL